MTLPATPTVAAAWETYGEDVVPTELRFVRRGHQRAFYAGAAATLELLSRIAHTAGGEVEATEALQTLHREVIAWITSPQDRT